MSERTFYALDSNVRLAAPAAGLGVERALDAAATAFIEHDHVLGRAARHGELYELHRVRPSPVRVSPLVFRAVRAALDASLATGGLFDVTAPVIPAAQRTRSNVLVAAGPSRPAAHVIGGATRSVVLDDARMTAALPAGARLDLSGIGRALAVDAAAGHVAPFRGFMIDAGGDLRVSDASNSGAAWRIAVGEPGNDDQALTFLNVREGAVATRAAGVVVDPRTGLPAQTDVVSATVIAGTMVGAHAFACAAVVAESDEALRLLDRRCIAGLLVLSNGDIRATVRMRAYAGR